MKDIFQFFLQILPIIISWPVVAFVVIMIFRKNISESLPDISGRLKKLSTPFGEFDFEPKVINTALGKTNISNVAIKSSNASIVVIEDIQETYVDDTFVISWPKNLYHADLEAGKKVLIGFTQFPSQKIPVFIMRSENVDDFRPNVNVLIDVAGSMELEEYMESTVKLMQKMNWEVTSSQVNDEKTVAFITLNNSSMEQPLYQFQRISVSHGKAYCVTASVSQKTLDSGNTMVVDELSKILNSFRLLT